MGNPVKARPGDETPGTGRRIAGSRAPHKRRARGSQRAAGSGDVAPRGPKVDLGGLDQYTGYVVRRAQVWIFQDFKKALKELDVTPAQFSVMKIVAANPGIAQARVAEALSIERARLVQMLDRLEARRLVERARSASDRRSHALHLTDEGVRLLGRLEERVAAHERHVVARLGTKGKSELLRLLAPFLR